MAGDGFRLDPPHSSACYLNQQGRQEFIVHDGHEMRDKRGRKYADGRGTTWERFRCNCIHCPAIALVRFDKLVDFIADGLGGEG